MEIHLKELLATTRRMVEILAHHTGRSIEQVAIDIERDRYMTAEEAKDYGLIDEIIVPRRGVSALADGAGATGRAGSGLEAPVAGVLAS